MGDFIFLLILPRLAHLKKMQLVVMKSTYGTIHHVVQNYVQLCLHVFRGQVNK